MPHEHPAKQADAAMDSEQSGSNEAVQEPELLIQNHCTEDIPESDSNDLVVQVQEAELLIKELNDLRIGEPISEQQMLDYFDSLASKPPWINLRVELERGELAKQSDRHALYRLRYYKHKFSRQASKEELRSDKSRSILDVSEDECNKEFLKKEGFFKRFEKDKAFDWFIHPDYLYCSLLDDYQRLVLKNHCYDKWSKYHRYLHSYEIEREYVSYCEELSKQLKWMEPYVDMDRQSVKWSKICCRGAYQALKIAATSFHKITRCLAFGGFYECKNSMNYNVTWFKEYDGLYFEIWRRVAHGMSFRDALQEVYGLNRFLLRQDMMKAALEHEPTMNMMEEEFHTCTAAVTPEVKEDEAKDLIAEAVNKRVQEPKFYEQYIRKKIHVARIIGILDSEE